MLRNTETGRTEAMDETMSKKWMMKTAGTRRRGGVNVRLIVFLAVIALLVGAPITWYLREQFTGGIEHLSDGTLAVDLKAISTFPFDQQYGTLQDIPEQFRALDGKRVRVEGQIWAPNSASNRLRSFDLCYSIAKCCFSGPPQIQHFVQSRVAEGKTVPYIDGQVRAVGTLHVKVQRDGDKITSVYQLDIDHLEPA